MQTKYLIFIFFAFILTPLFSKESENDLFPLKQAPVKTKQVVTGISDSLSKAKKLFDKNEYQKALNTALNALDLGEKQKDILSVKKSNTLIADIFNKSNNFEKALEYYKRNLNYENSDFENLDLKFKIANMYYQIEQFDSSKFILKEIIHFNSSSHEIEILKGNALMNLSAIEINNQNFEIAENHLYKALKIFKDNGKRYGNVLNNLAAIKIEQKRFGEAKKILNEAILLLDENDPNYQNKMEGIYDNLSYVLYNLKDYKAYYYQEKSFELRDSLRNVEIVGILADIEGKYNEENIKKQEQIKVAQEQSKAKHAQDINIILSLIISAIVFGGSLFYRYFKLKQKNLQLELQQSQLIQQSKLEKLQSESREKIINATLDGKESERKMIAETLHHSVSSLLSSAGLHLQAAKMILKDTSPEEINKAHFIIKEASEKIRNLSHALVSSVLLKFGLKYALQDLCEKYSNSALTFSCDCETLNRYPLDFELKINSIIDELLNNILKHSNAKNSELILKEKNGYLEISIIDDGYGFNLKTLKEKTGLGLRQIETRISKMKGIFTINSELNVGTNIFISVPIPSENNEIQLN